jgi:hypothetical protein
MNVSWWLLIQQFLRNLCGKHFGGLIKCLQGRETILNIYRGFVDTFDWNLGIYNSFMLLTSFQLLILNGIGVANKSVWTMRRFELCENRMEFESMMGRARGSIKTLGWH